MDNEISTMQEEVSTYAKKIEEICKIDGEVDSLYLGTQIYMSPLQQSDFIFIGINPGSGAYKYGGQKPHCVTPSKKSEFETEEFQLQNEWVTIFGEKNKINNIDLLYNAVKTNCCFFATEDTSKLKRLKSILKYKYKLDITEKENEWIKLIINYVEPNIIICEGFEAFNQIQRIYKNEEFDMGEHWINHRKAYLNGYIPVLGFKRIYSRFADLEDTVETIYDAMKETHIIDP